MKVTLSNSDQHVSLIYCSDLSDGHHDVGDDFNLSHSFSAERASPGRPQSRTGLAEEADSLLPRVPGVCVSKEATKVCA